MEGEAGKFRAVRNKKLASRKKTRLMVNCYRHIVFRLPKMFGFDFHIFTPHGDFIPLYVTYPVFSSVSNLLDFVGGAKVKKRRSGATPAYRPRSRSRAGQAG
jgi:hypothetical protein